MKDQINCGNGDPIFFASAFTKNALTFREYNNDHRDVCAIITDTLIMKVNNWKCVKYRYSWIFFFIFKHNDLNTICLTGARYVS